MPFGGKLLKTSRWVKLASMMPCEHIAQIYIASMIVRFRKRFPVEFVAKITEHICTGVWPDQQRNVDCKDAQNENPQGNPDRSRARSS